MTLAPLSREEVVRRLQSAEREIPLLGVARLALFGSVLRDEARADSDVDLLVGFAPGAKSFDSWGRGSWPRRRMSFEPRDYFRCIPNLPREVASVLEA